MNVLSNVVFPYNMPDLGNEPELYVDMISKDKPLLREDIQVNRYDETFWQSLGITVLTMEWLPFFVNCQGHDQHVLIYDLLEQSDECTLV